MVESKYEGFFKRFAELNVDSKHFKLKGPTALIEILPEIELKTESGLILAKALTHKQQSADFRPRLGLVLYIGEGYTDGSNMELRPGMVIFLPTEVKQLSEFPGLKDYTANTLGIINENDILCYYQSRNSLECVTSSMNNG